jgi:hypothetical protein
MCIWHIILVIRVHDVNVGQSMLDRSQSRESVMTLAPENAMATGEILLEVFR